MLSNFPIGPFDAPLGAQPRWPTFGIKLSTRPDAMREGLVNAIHDTKSMTMAMLNTLTGFYDRMHVEDPSVTARTIFVDTFGVKATDFDLDTGTQTKLFASGQKAARDFLDGADGQPGWDFEQYTMQYRS
jgi:NTE family protein